MKSTPIMAGASRIGTVIRSDSGENETLLDSHGNKLGSYQASSGMTLDRVGKPLAWKGQGNQLLRLLPAK